MFDSRNPYPGMQYGAFPGGMGMMRPPFNPYAQPQGPQPSVQPPDETPVQEAVPWIYVPNAKDIYQVTVQPSHTVWVMSQNEPAFAVRTADSKGNVKADIEVTLKDKKDNSAVGTTDSDGTLVLPATEHKAYVVGYEDGEFKPENNMTKMRAILQSASAQ